MEGGALENFSLIYVFCDKSLSPFFSSPYFFVFCYYYFFLIKRVNRKEI